MRIPLGRDHNVELTGYAWRSVDCEECGENFVYALERDGAGSGYSLLLHDESGAKVRANDRAQKDLQQKLDNEIDPVPCPACGHVQTSMIDTAKENYAQWLTYSAVTSTLLFAFFVIAAINCDAVSSRRIAGILAAIGGVLAIGSILVQKLLRKNYDPNQIDLPTRLEQGRLRAVSSKEQAESGTVRLQEIVDANLQRKALSEYRFNLIGYSLIPAIMFLGLGLFMVRFSWSEIATGIASYSWPMVPGSIQRLDVICVPSMNGKETLYELNVAYSFHANGKKFTGRRYRLFPVKSARRDEIERLKEVLTAQPPTISYNPAQPEQNVICPGFSTTRFLFNLIGPVLSALCLFAMLRAMRRLLRSRKELEHEWQIAAASG